MFPVFPGVGQPGNPGIFAFGISISRVLRRGRTGYFISITDVAFTRAATSSPAFKSIF